MCSGPPEPIKKEIDHILWQLSQEFVETAGDQLEAIEACIDGIEAGQDMSLDALFDIQRNIHNIKGQGATFGFPLIGRMAHLFEDYLENVGGVQRENIEDLRIFIYTMMEILSTGEQFEPHQAQSLLRGLPRGRPRAFSAQATCDVNVLLVMPGGTQRKMVAHELFSCGFKVNRVHNSMAALAMALDLAPDVVFMNDDMTPFTGRELAKVFASINKLMGTHVVLFTSYAHGDEHLKGLPENISVVKKDTNYRENLGELLMKWGMFGHVVP